MKGGSTAAKGRAIVPVARSFYGLTVSFLGVAFRANAEEW